MKKTICIILTLILTLTFFASCGKKAVKDTDTTAVASDTGKSEIAGYWKGNFDGEKTVFDFEDDGKGTMYFTSGGYDFYCEIEWSTDGGTLTLTSDGAVTEYGYTLENGTLHFADTAFEKASEDDIPENAINVIDIIEETK